jgi:hypothetical protein
LFWSSVSVKLVPIGPVSDFVAVDVVVVVVELSAASAVAAAFVPAADEASVLVVVLVTVVVLIEPQAARDKVAAMAALAVRKIRIRRFAPVAGWWTG